MTITVQAVLTLLQVWALGLVHISAYQIAGSTGKIFDHQLLGLTCLQ